MNAPNITSTSMKNVAQEAMETAAQTKAEAAKGDQQAIRKLAHQQAANNSAGTNSNTQITQQLPNVVDSTTGKLDIKA
jgi:hypothetical protein